MPFLAILNHQEIRLEMLQPLQTEMLMLFFLFCLALFSFLLCFSTQILNDKDAASYVSGIGIHWYHGDFTVVSKTHTNHPSKFILATEACNGYELFHNAVNLGDWGRGEIYSNDIIQVSFFFYFTVRLLLKAIIVSN